jgi:hypothetical protein
MQKDEVIFCFQQSPEGGYEARALGHSIFTQAKTMDELRASVEDAVRCHFARKGTLPTIRLVEAKPKGNWLGSAKGEFTIPDDFNDPLPKDIEDLFW